LFLEKEKFLFLEKEIYMLGSTRAIYLDFFYYQKDRYYSMIIKKKITEKIRYNCAFIKTKTIMRNYTRIRKLR